MLRLKFPGLPLVLPLSLLAAAGLVSCQKVISLDLNSPAPQLVVEGTVSDKPGACIVRLSKTVNFTNITEIPAVSGATVRISDTLGNSEILPEKGGGIYMSDNFHGIPGQSYKLTIMTGGQFYESESFMPYPVSGVRLNITPEAEDRPSLADNGGPPPLQYQVNYEIDDPENFTNYYRFVVFHKNRLISSRRVLDDQFHNGKIIAGEFGLHDTIDFRPGDTVFVQLQNIDKGTFDFFRTLRDGAGGLSFLSASPSNPISNISNNGLGYFSAFSATDTIAVIPY